jgi:6-phosphogluconate dehydrogenase
MTLGLVGLGRMGAGIVGRLRAAGHTVIAFDADARLTETPSIEAMIAQLPAARVVWVMVPAGAATEGTLTGLAGLLRDGDMVIDGGNSYVKDTVRRAAGLAEQGIRLLDCGTSGGIWGLKDGFCLMVGGDKAAFDLAEPLFASLAAEGGHAYLGSSGAGHYAKMVHNAIEYGMLQAYAEGFDLLRAADEYGYDLRTVSSLWNRGSVVRSWLLELAGHALAHDPQLTGLSGYVDDSGEGRWAVTEAVERGVSVAVLAEALFARFTSREDDSFAMRFIAALRREFGAHPVKPP